MGDVVGIGESGLIQKVRADIAVGDEEQIPAIGLVAEVMEETNKVKVAIGGTVGGFRDLAVGQRYYLADSYWEVEILTQSLKSEASSTEMVLSSLMPHQPEYLGEMIQVMGIARSESEILIMPSLDYRLVDSGSKVPQETIIYNNYIIEENDDNDSGEQSEDSGDTTEDNDSGDGEDQSEDETGEGEETDDGTDQGDEETETDEDQDSGEGEEGSETEESGEVDEGSGEEGSEENPGDSVDEGDNSSTEEVDEPEPVPEPEPELEPTPEPEPVVEEVVETTPEPTPEPVVEAVEDAGTE